MNERDRMKDPCAEYAAKLEPKLKELEEKQAEIESLIAKSFRAVGLAEQAVTAKEWQWIRRTYDYDDIRSFLEEFVYYSKLAGPEEVMKRVKRGDPEWRRGIDT